MVLRDVPSGHQVLLLKRATRPFLGEWFPVEGGIDAGEHPDDAVIRELREETQLVASAVYKESVRIVPSESFDVRLHMYASFVSRSSEVVLNREHTAFQWLSFDRAQSIFPLPAQREALHRIRAQFIDSPPPAGSRVR